MATLLAVSVGLPREVRWGGRTVRTAVWKQPVDGPRMVRRLNIDGDRQADLGGHGGEQRAVLVYQADSYRYWQEVLGRDDFSYGQFGENFTVDGLADDEVCIGDRYRIGEAEFEVTQPRVTCYRVGIRMGEPRMAALLVSHRRPGFYLRVLTEGQVQAGDEIVKISTGPEAMTVAEMDALLYLPGHARRDLRRALRIPALSPGWQASFRAMLDQADGNAAAAAPGGSGGAGAPAGNAGLNKAAAAPPPAWNGFRAFRVTGREEESRDVTSYRLAAADGADPPAALPGQFITVRVRPADAGPLLRSYSLSAPPGAGGYRISVKREPGRMSGAWLHENLTAGAAVEVAAPRGVFTINGDSNPLLLLSAGIGVTPVLAILHALAAERSEREIWWLHGARNGTEHPFAAEVRSLLSRLPNARSHICYSRPGPADRAGHDYDTPGRLSGELIGRLGVPRGADTYLCGPAAFMADLSASLTGLGFQPSRIRTETFGSAGSTTPGVVAGAAGTARPHPPAGTPGRGPAVSFARNDLTVAWDEEHGSLLELAEACDVPVRWSCRTGVCHTCETPLLSGSVRYSPDPVDPPAAGNVLVCCARPETEVALDL